MYPPEPHSQVIDELPVRKSSGLAIAALIFGIFSMVGGAYFLIPPILAAAFGHCSLGKFKTNPCLEGKGFAIAGIVMGWLGLSLWILGFLLFGGVAILASIASVLDPKQETLELGQPIAQPEIASNEINAIPTGDFEIDRFFAVNYVPVNQRNWTVSISNFTHDGPISGTAFPVDPPSIYPLNQIAIDESGPEIYGITTHQFGYIKPTTGEFVEVPVDPTLPKMSWPSAIAFDSKNRKVAIVSRTGSYYYYPDTKTWLHSDGFSKLNLMSLTYDESDLSFYGIAPSTNGANLLIKLNDSGAVLSSTQLSHPLPMADTPLKDRLQLVRAGEHLVILISPHYDRAGVRIPGSTLVVDPENGEMHRVTSGETVSLSDAGEEPPVAKE